MNRWIVNFQNHPFQKPWKDLIESTENISLQDETIATDVQELARLKKVIAYIDELLEAADPELLPANLLGSFQDQTMQALDQVNQYNSNKNIGHLTNANNNLDNLLTYIRPYVAPGKGAPQAATKAFKAYSDTVNQQIDELRSKVSVTVTETQQNKSDSEQILKDIKKSQEKIQKLEKDFLTGGESEKSLQERMLGLLNDAQGWHTKISDFHKRLTSGNEQESALSLQIEEAKKTSIKNAEATASALKSSEDLIANLEEFYIRIFGEEDDTGKVQGGLKKELADKLLEIDDFKKKQTETYDALIKEIESLLPGATSAGLATAYHDLKESFEAPIKTYTHMFYWSLSGIFICALILITHKIGGTPFIEFVDVSDPMKIFNNLMYKLPILLPLLWLAIFASKRRSEDRRLQQEYAHKEAIAKSYQSFKKQIEALGAKDDDLTRRLLETAILAIAFNASTTLDKKHGDKFPLQEAVENLAKSANPLKKGG